MINAKEAKEATDKATEAATLRSLKEVQHLIHEAVSQAKYGITYTGFVSRDLIVSLRDLGYNVAFPLGLLQEHILISWKE